VSRLAAEVPEPAVQERLKRLADAAEASVAPVVVPEAVTPEEGGAPSEEAPLPVTEAKEPAEARPQPDMELGVDYNAMRARIEQTRGRLKAKAFDAMMTGESALLGRESPEKAAERPGPQSLITTSTRPSRPPSARRRTCSSFQNEALAAESALGGVMRRSQSRP